MWYNIQRVVIERIQVKMSVEKKENNDRHRRVGRVRLFKKIILLLLIMAIAAPLLLCAALFGKVNALEEQIEELSKSVAAKEEIRQELKQIENEKLASEALQQESRVLQNTGQAETEKEPKQVYLTFDDGPSANTEEILDILKEYQVKATFFVVGKTDAKSQQMYQRIVSEGHTLGMHSYSHNYKEIYDSEESYREDLVKLQSFLRQITGITPNIVRFPGGSSNSVSRTDMHELIQYLDENNITYYDWNVASGDAASGYVSMEQIVDNCLEGIARYKKEAVILMHDANDKGTTVEALPIIIESIQKMEDTVLLPITEKTVPIQHLIK